MKRLSVIAAIFFTVSFVLPSFLQAQTSVTIAGDLQSELGCAGDWDPACSASFLTYNPLNDIWKGTFNVPAGNWQYKIALDGNWNVSYGLNTGGNNIPLNLAGPTSVSFYFDSKSHWITDNHNSIIATVPGDYQHTIGCGGDWNPSCLRSWLEDPNGSGTYSFTATIPQGSYECKVAINEGWDENYGQNGQAGGANIPFTVKNTTAQVTFTYDPTSHILTITGASPAHDNN